MQLIFQKITRLATNKHLRVLNIEGREKADKHF